MSLMKTVLITGCSSGIGYACAVMLKARGYHVITTVRNRKDQKRLKNEGFESVLLLELSQSESVQSVICEVKKIAKSGLYALFNNAAYGQPGAVEDLSRQAIEQQFSVNLFGTHELTVGLLPLLKDYAKHHGSARLVQNSSILGFAAMPIRGAYNASKFALEGLSDTLRMELKSTNVKVILIEPGPIKTCFRANALKALQNNIDIKASNYKVIYEKSIARLSKKGAGMPFTLPAEAVANKLVLALECRFPQSRYAVTLPTHLFAVLKRIFPTWLLDILSIKASQSGD